MKLALIICCITFCTFTVRAQKSQFKFAQTHFGVQSEFLTNGKGMHFASQRLLIGGNHFWGKADFYISIPLLSAELSISKISNYSSGVITGARWIPFGLSSKAPRPFMGAQWVTPRFSTSLGGMTQKSRLGLELGASLVFNKSWTIELGCSYIANQNTPYYTSRKSRETLKLPRYSVNLSVKKFFDFTAGIGSETGREYALRAKTHFDAKNLLSTWSVALGLTSNILLSPYNFASEQAFLPKKPRIALAPDLALGYYLHSADLGLRLSYRPFRLSQSAYGFEWEAKIHRLHLEAFKFLTDYNGFVPFAGAGVGYEFTALRIADNGATVTDLNDSAFNGAVVVGWEIRPNDVQWYILRTNIRYIVDSKSYQKELKISSDHLEIDFIQFVFYPSRFKNRNL